MQVEYSAVGSKVLDRNGPESNINVFFGGGLSC